MVTYGGEQSLDRYLALSARGVPFNVAHATGNFVIALAAGPALVRMISRFRTRLEFEWRPAGAISLLLVALVAAGAAGRRRLERGGRRREGPGELLARARPERRRRLLGDAGTDLEPGDDRLGDARPRGRRHATRSTCARAARRRCPTCAPQIVPAALGRRPRADDPRARRRRARPAPLRRPRPRRAAAQAARPRRLGRRPGEPHRVLRPRDARRRRGHRLAEAARRPGCAARRTRTAAGASSRRRPSEADSTGATLQGLAAGGREGPGERRAARAWLRRAQRSSGGCALAGTGVVNSQSTAWADPGPGRDRRRRRGRSTARSATSAACAPPTATTATRRPATRRRSGSPPRSCSRSSAGRSRSRRCRARQARNRGDDARSGTGGGESSSAGATSPAQPTGSAPRRAAAARASLPRRRRPAPGRAPTRRRSRRPPAARTRPAPAGGGSAATPATGAGERRHRPGAEPGASAPDASAGRRPGPGERRVRAPTARRGGGDDRRRGRGRSRCSRFCARRRASVWYRRAHAMTRAGSLASASRRWTSRQRSARAAPTRPTGPSRSTARRSTSCFELARWAPNHNLTNPWRFRVLGPEALRGSRRRPGPRPRRSSTARRRWSRAPACSPATRSRTRRTCSRRAWPRTSSCSPLTPAAWPATGARRGCCAPTPAATAVGIGTNEHFVALIHLGRPVQEQPGARARAGRLRRRPTWS